MKIAPNPGCLTDMPIYGPTPFWYYSENVRWRMGIPETVGLYERLRAGSSPVNIPLNADTVDFFADRNLVFLGHGQTVSILNANTGIVTNLNLPGAGTSGRWWFTGSEEQRYTWCGRSDYFGKTYVIDRQTLVAAEVSAMPDGGRAGGIVGGIFVKAGTKGATNNGPWLVVRWSARRSDPANASGLVGFEDWTPTDINSAGEFTLDAGSVIVGGGSTDFGFIVWTDVKCYLLRPRTDANIFSLVDLSKRGLFSSQSWGEADGRIFWYDQTRTLNVYDGGTPRQILCPMRHVTSNLILDADVGTASMSTNGEYGEVSLHYRDRSGVWREVIYNYREDAWYAFSLGRISMTGAQSERPSIGINASGDVFFYDLPEVLPSNISNPVNSPLPALPLGETGRNPEPFSFFLMTNRVTGENLSNESIRQRQVALSYVRAGLEGVDISGDEITVAIQSYGTLDMDEVPLVQDSTQPVGKMLFPVRAGGKALQYVISGSNIKQMLRFGALDTEADAGGEK